jgi:hypothetical protein
MKLFKYICAAICGLIAIGELLPAYLILKGLMTQHVEHAGHFWVKFLIHCGYVAVLTVVAVRLFKNARGNKKE